MDDFYTTDELARLMRVQPGTVRFWRHSGRGPKGIRAGRRVLYARSEIERWLAEKGCSETGRAAS